MRKKIFLLVLACVMSMILGACGKDVSEEEFLNDFGDEYAGNYTVMEKNDDGTSKISIVAPNIEELVRIIFEDNQEEELDIGRIQDAIDDYPDCQKEYIFEVNEVTDGTIGKKFYDEIARELVIAAFENIEFREEWSTGE